MKNHILNSGMEIFRYLNSAECTSRFQSYFGVERLSSTSNDKSHIIDQSSTNHTDHGDQEMHKRLKSNDDDDARKSIQLKPTPQHLYRIQNRFAYYLFKFGSLLGQEEFYISFFPFWFWNFDGPTGISNAWVMVSNLNVSMVEAACISWELAWACTLRRLLWLCQSARSAHALSVTLAYGQGN